MSELIMKRPDCPVCGKPTVGIEDICHCGRMRLLLNINDHYLGFDAEPPGGWPKKGCPVCGRPMQKVGKWKPLRMPGMEEPKGEGLDRMLCDQPDHYCYVTKAWYIEHQR